ncbi:MAG TPA: NAD(P)/FAD-dependent oxidoreductase [Thermoanaerobaculia bacterium]|nr:NAD(P)/FAD-dependent oxidoreductase [Thermoanaerobaculia bacterium]
MSECLTTETVVVGAGPAGLAVAGCLGRLGRPYAVLERAARVGDAWHRHYERLHLHTVKETSHLPHRPFPAHYPRYVPRRLVVEYLDDYAWAMGVEPRFGEEVVRVEPVAGGARRWRTITATGTVVESDHVVMATGFNRVPSAPRWEGMEGFRGAVEHSRGYRDGEPFRGRRVLVVGMGNTGAEIALDLAEHDARPVISVRGPVNIVPRDVLGRPTQRTALLLARLPPRLGDALGVVLRRLTVGDLSRWGIATPALPPAAQLREEARTPVIDVGTLARIRDGSIRVRPAIDRFLSDGVRFADGSEEPFDHVILATGYRPAIEQIVAGGEVLLDERGNPAVTSATGAHAGLHLVGFDAYTVGGLLGTIRRDALRVAQCIAESEDSMAAPGDRDCNYIARVRVD